MRIYIVGSTWFFAFFCAGLAWAGPSPLPSGAPDVAVAINTWGGMINVWTLTGAAGVLGGFLEIILRALPTQKPLSIGYAIADFCRAIGNFFDALAGAADKILPNRLK